MTKPVFKHYPDWLIGAKVLSQDEINFMLGMGIPALTPSVGSVSIGNFDENQIVQFDLNSIGSVKTNFKPNGWPKAGHSRLDVGQWLHNDIKDVAYWYSYRLFDTIVKSGGLK